MSATAAQSWFAVGGLIATGDVFPLGFVRPEDTLRAGHWIWGTSVASTGSADYYPQLLMVPALFAKGLAVVGVGPAGAERLFLTIVFAALAPSMFCLLRILLPARKHAFAAFVGALFYAFNPALLWIVPNMVYLLALGLMPLLAVVVVRGSRSRSWWWPILLALACALLAYVFLNPAMFVVVMAVPIVTAGLMWFRGESRDVVLFVIRASLLAALASAWWLLPVAVTLFGSSGTSVSTGLGAFGWSWTHERSSIANVVKLTPFWAWGSPAYLPFSVRYGGAVLGTMQFVPALACLAGAVIARGRVRSVALTAVSVGALLVVFAKGLHPPFSGFNEELYRGIPGMWLFREPTTKLTPVLAGLFSVGMACLLASITGKRTQLVVAGAMVGVIAALSFPLWTGQVIVGERGVFPAAHVRIPDYWWAAAGYLNRRPGPTLVLPLDDYYQMPYRWYYGTDVVADELIDAPVIKDPRTNTYFQQSPGSLRTLVALRQAIDEREWFDAAVYLRALGVRWILLRRDLRGGFRGRAFDDPELLAGSLRRTNALRFARTFGRLELFELRAARPAVYAARQVVRIPAGAAVSSFLTLPLQPSLTAVAAEGTAVPSAHEVTTISADEWRPGRRGFDSGFVVNRGDYRLFTRWQEGVTADVELARSSAGLRLRARAPVVSVGGRTTGQAFRATEVFEPNHPGRAVATVGRTLLQLGARRNTLRIGAVVPPGRSSLSFYARPISIPLRDPSFERGTWSHVFDCARGALGSGRRAALSATRVRGGVRGKFSLSLRATGHSACVGQVLVASRPEGVYRLAFDYKHLAGSAPRACVWEPGIGKCVPLPPFDPRPGWRRFDRLFVADRNAASLELLLYSDGQSGPSTNLYDDVRFWRLPRAGQGWLNVPKQWMDGGLTTLRRAVLAAHVSGTAPVGAAIKDPSFERTTWGGVDDCRRVDARSLTDAGIAGRRVPGANGGRYALALTARAHSACVHQVVQGFQPGLPYRLRLAYRHVSGVPPHVCVWEIGPDRCADIPALTTSSRWQRFDTVLRPDRRTTDLEVFLYADGRSDTTKVLYDDVRIEPIARPYVALVQAASVPTARPADVSIVRRTPASYELDVQGRTRPFLLALDTTFDHGWRLRGVSGARHVEVDGYANGWIVPRGDRVRLELRYAPQAWAEVARRTSTLGFPLALLLVAGAALLRRNGMRTVLPTVVLRRAAAVAAPVHEHVVVGSGRVWAGARPATLAASRAAARPRVRTAAASGFFVIATVLWLAPLLQHPASSVLGRGPSDATSFIRDQWAISRQQTTPFTWTRDRLVVAPEGRPREPGVAASDPLHVGILWFGGRLLGWTLAFNLYLCLAFVLAGLVTFLLLDRLRFGFLPSLFGGYVFAFAPEHFWMAFAGHVGRAQTWVLPLAVLTLVLAREQRTRARYALVGLACALCFYLDPYLGLFGIGVLGIFGAVDLLLAGRSRRKGLAGYAVAAATLALALTPALLALVLHPALIDIGRGSHDIITFGARLSEYFLPSESNPLAGGLVRSYFSSHPAARNFDEATLFFGFTTMALAAFALVQSRRRGLMTSDRLAILFGSGLVAVGFLFSRPSLVDVGGFQVPGPAHLVAHVTANYRAFARFGVLVGLGLVLLASVGIREVLARRGALLAWALFGLVAVELAVGPPIHVWRTNHPPADVAWLRAHSGGIVATYPLYEANGAPDGAPITVAQAESFFFQIYHGHPLFGGAQLDGSPAQERRIVVRDLDDRATASLLARDGVRYVVVRADLYRSIGQEPPSVRRGYRLVARAGNSAIYRLVAAPDEMPVQAVAFRGPEGFYAPFGADRWMATSGEIRVHAFTRHVRIRLELRASTRSGGQRLTLLDARGRRIGERSVGPTAQTIAFGPLALRRGRNDFRLVARFPGTPFGPDDPRLVTVLVSPLRVRAADGPLG